MNTRMVENLRRQTSGSQEILQRTSGEFPIAIPRRAEFRCSSIVLLLLTPYLVLRREYVQKILLAIVILDIPFQLGTHLFYRDADAVFGALAGLSISATTIALFGLYASWFIRALESRSHKAHSSTRLNVPLLFYLGFTALSLVVARDMRLSRFEVFLLVQEYLEFFYRATFVGSR